MFDKSVGAIFGEETLAECGYLGGGGKIGVALKSLVDQTNATVLYFVDLYCEQEECESLRIYGKEELPYVDLIIITPIWDEHEVINLLDSMNIYGSSIICVDRLLKECKR